MKSNTAELNNVVVHGAQQSGQFTIAANGKAFKILIDGLYSNKPQAIIRELSSNAYDSQRDAGRGDMQFDLYLPNMLDPTFAVRDYGTSLSHEGIMGLYTTVFMSTKEDSNNAVGKFGLGSKTPFAYTDNFTVTAFMRGTKRVYGAYIAGDGIPQISLMASEDTDELDGLMVTFPVKTQDCEKFRVEAERVLEGFDVKPRVKGAQINFEPYKLIHTGSNFKIYETDYYNKKPRARQGCVIYPIDISALSGATLTQAQKNVLNTNVIIDFPIGELDITPSRESLSYDDTTVNNILSMLTRIDEELVKEIVEEYESVKTKFEAINFKKKRNGNNIPSISNFIDKLSFNGKPVSEHYYVQRDRLKRNYGLDVSYFGEYDAGRLKTLKFNTQSYQKSWEIDDEVLIVIEKPGDKLTHASARIKANIQDYKKVLWVKLGTTTEKQFRSFKKLLGYPPKFFYLPDFQLPAKEKSNDPIYKISKTECHIERLGPRETLTCDTIDLETLDKNTKYLVLFSDEFLIDPNDPKTSISWYTFNKLFPDTTKLIGVRKAHYKKLANAGFRNALIEKRDELFNSIDFKKQAESDAIDELIDHNIKKYASLFNKYDYNRDTPVKKMLDLLRRYVMIERDVKNDESISMWQDLVSALTYRNELASHQIIVADEDTLSSHVIQIIKDYPLLEHIFDYTKSIKSPETVAQMMEYIELLDLKRETIEQEKVIQEQL